MPVAVVGAAGADLARGSAQARRAEARAKLAPAVPGTVAGAEERCVARVASVSWVAVALAGSAHAVR